MSKILGHGHFLPPLHGGIFPGLILLCRQRRSGDEPGGWPVQKNEGRGNATAKVAIADGQDRRLCRTDMAQRNRGFVACTPHAVFECRLLNFIEKHPMK